METDRLAGLPDAVLPDEVYVPVEAVHEGMTGVNFELRHFPNGEVAALAYTSHLRLVNCCGDDQPWVLMPSERLLALQSQLRFHRVILDLDLPDDQRLHEEGD